MLASEPLTPLPFAFAARLKASASSSSSSYPAPYPPYEELVGALSGGAFGLALNAKGSKARTPPCEAAAAFT